MEHPPAGAVMSDPAGASKSETGIVASSAGEEKERHADQLDLDLDGELDDLRHRARCREMQRA
jgi:hypothetical protein